MKPLKLEFSGINSFSEHTIIDFEALTKGGLFGIFGDTGSGKSTILDCINFALYGDVERSSGKTDIINYHSSAAEVRFVFDILNEGKRRRYTVERIIKKDKSGTHKAALYVSDGETELCIADKPSSVEKEIEEIIGLDAKDFRKCIALPQGEFAQFVKSTPSERLALIERLFDLARYGNILKEKITARQNAVESEYRLLSDRMTRFDGVTEDGLKSAKRELREEKKRLKDIQANRKAAAERRNTLKILSDKRAELIAARSALEALSNERVKMEELRRDLNALPKCREAAETHSDIEKKRADIQKLSADIDSCAVQADKIASEIAKTENELSQTDYDGEIDRLTKLSAAYEACAGKPERLSSLNKSLVNKRAEFKRAEAALEELAAKRVSAQKELAEAENSVGDRGVGSVEKFIGVDLKGSVLRGEYAHILEYLAKLRGDIRVFCDDGALYKYVSGELDAKIEEYKQKLAYLKDVGSEDITEAVRQLQTALELREKQIAELNGRRNILSAIEADIRLKQTEIERIRDEGADLRARSDEVKSELDRAFGAGVTDYKACSEANAQRLENIKKRRKELSDQLKGAQDKVADLRAEILKLGALKTSAEEELKKLGIKLEEEVRLSGKGGIDKCLALADEFLAFPDAQKSLDTYDKSVTANTERVNSLSDVEGIEDATDDEVKSAEAALAAAESEELAVSGNIAVLTKNCEDLSDALVKKAELKKELDLCAADRKVVSGLKEITKNNEFFKFIANEYLCEISSEASSTLLKLTDGRYFLIYKADSFNVGDNFDCGNLRGVNTLSGGETFLVSLSLALALSRKICARSRRSIEFFFLDEGFGTLDGTLIDTVVTALEKLKSSDFTIGVISHVEELKQRIDSRITVIKATETRGSIVRLSC